MPIKPITPREVSNAAKIVIPEKVIDIFNHLILKSWNGYCAVVDRNVVIEQIYVSLHISRDTVFEKHYLDVQSIFRRVGWKVSYEVADSGTGVFIFEKKKKGRS